MNQDNDFIILNAFGKIAKWRFPDTLDCPSKRCHKKFSNRPAAISHYQTNHVAKNAILCTICKKPVNVRFLGDINSHYRKHKQILNVGHHINAPFRKHIELKRLVNFNLNSTLFVFFSFLINKFFSKIGTSI